MSSSAVNWSDDEATELVNDDGFVYKRIKRQRTDSDAPSSTSSSIPPPPDPVQLETQKRDWKIYRLMRLKEAYQREISQWENLSNTLNALENRELQRREGDALLNAEQSGSGQNADLDNGSEAILDKLFLKVEQQEATIQDVSNLCDIAESLCDAQEEYMKQSLFDLHIWASPRHLMKSLCDD